MKNIPELTKIEKQIIWYAKGWYGRSDKGIIEDIKVIMGKICMIDIDHISNNDVKSHLISTLLKVCDNYFTMLECIEELSGIKIINREMEQIFIGKISICDGGYLNGCERMDFDFS